MNYNMTTREESSRTFGIGETAQDEKLTCIPVVDLDGMCDPIRRPTVVEEITNACQLYGFFQVANHGIPEPIIKEAMLAATNFFSLPTRDKAKFMSNNMYEPVRYCTSLKGGGDRVHYWRIFLKHYANPLQDWIRLWPDNPPDYRYSKFSPLHSQSSPCPEPQHSLGLPPHSDYSCLTILHQDSFGLEILGFEDETWKGIPVIPGILQVHVGDHLEVLSNGRYKSVVHRATLNSKKQRISIASLHSLGMDVKMGAAKELVDEHHPNRYKESSFRDFLDFMSKTDLGQGSCFHETLKIRE